MLHPIDDLAIQRLLNGDVCHCCCGRSSMPMLFAGRKPDHITRPDFVDWTAPNLDQSNPRRNDQCLTKRMCMPCGAGSRLKRDARATDTRWFGCLEQRVKADYAGKPLARSFAGGLRTTSS